MTLEYVAIWAVGLLLSTIVAAEIIRYDRTLGWGVLTAMLASYLIANMVLVPRVVSIPLAASLGISATVVSGTIFWPFIGQIIDMVNEVYGRRKAYISAFVGFFGRIVFILFVMMAMTADPVFNQNWTPEREGWWQGYFGQTARILAAAIASYALAQAANIYVFAKLKERWLHRERTVGQRVRFGVIRSWASDMVDTLVDSPTFYVLAFAGVLPWPVILNITITAMVFKFLVAQLNQPFYALFRWRTFGVDREL